MKPILKFSVLILLVGLLFIASCKKEKSCEGCSTNSINNTNKSPIAVAGPDQIITLPTDSISLDGNASKDPDGKISEWLWTKISGPASFTVIKPTDSSTKVKTLVAGIYLFELKVTDAGGLFSRDTVQVVVNVDVNNSCDINNRPLINAQLVPFATLSQERYGMAVASAGNKIVFAGGYAVLGNSSGYSGASRVDIYDVVTHNWSTAELSQPRGKMAVAISGNKIFFAGGEEQDFDDGGITLAYSNVDIYDASTNSWAVSSLSVPRRNLVGGSVGNKVFFAGGNSSFFNHPGSFSAVVDIYDLSTNAWSTSSLSQPRENLSAATVGNKIYFAGGNAMGPSISSRIDIYDNGIGTWSTSTLNEPKTNMACIAFAGKIYWSGGHNSGATVSSQVEIKDVNTQTSSLNCLYKTTEWYQFPNSAVEKNNKIVFFSGINHDPAKFDIYDILTNTWSIGSLSFYTQYAAIISVNNTIYVANGTKVWKLEF